MKIFAALGLIAVLASCGADGAPLRPSANLGLSIGPDGVTPSANVSANSGPVTVSVGL